MNLPNKLTIFRVFLIPVFVLAFYFLKNPWINTAIFVIASLTDTADGYIARKYNLVTNFGKFADPLADKLLVCTAMICMVSTAQIPAWVVIVIMAREFIISGFRTVAADNGIVIAASWWGKIKTIVQMVMIIALLLDFRMVWYTIMCTVLIYAALVLTIISMVDYLYKNRQVLADGTK